jgi:hypothetical protein
VEYLKDVAAGLQPEKEEAERIVNLKSTSRTGEKIYSGLSNVTFNR